MSTPLRIWLVLGSKPGDNAQALNVVRALGLPFERKTIVLKTRFDLAKPRVRASLHHVDSNASDPLAPPWPDLVLTIGRRMAMVALWIKSQSPNTRLALIGPPKREAERFDLIIVPMHYRVPDAPNICRIGLPLLGADPLRLKVEEERFANSLGKLPKPLTVLLAGGSIGSQSFDPATACGLIRQILDLSKQDGGSVFIATSRRTPEGSAEAMAQVLPATANIYRWKPNDPDNPYFGLLAHGDRFVVTGDSVSMLVEVARLGKPLAITQLRPANRMVATYLHRWRLPAGVVWWAARAAGETIERSPFGSASGSRDFSLLHNALYENGWAVPLGKPFIRSPAPPPNDASIAAARLHALLA